jgi:Tfp pilus assembly protein PilO
MLLGANLAVAASYTLPRGLKRRGIAARAQALRAEVEHRRQTVLELQQRADTVKENEQGEKRFLGEVLGTRKAALVPTLSELEKLAADPGLRAGSRSFNPELVKDVPLLRVEVGVQLTGGYRQLVEFLRGLEGSKHFVTVDRVTLRERAGGEEASAGALDVQVSAWFRAEEGDLPDAR